MDRSAKTENNARTASIPDVALGRSNSEFNRRTLRKQRNEIGSGMTCLRGCIASLST
jgi:hypothetical protein